MSNVVAFPQHQRLARQSMPGIRSGKPQREYAATLNRFQMFGQNGAPGLIDELILSWPRIAAGYGETRNQVAATDFPFVRPGTEEERTTELEEECCQALEVIYEEMRSDVVNDFGGKRQFQSELATNWFYGLGYFEASEYPDATATFGWRLELFWLHPTSLYQWRFDQDYLRAVWQMSELGIFEIPREKLIILTHGAFPVGDQGILRPATYPVETAKSAMESYGHRLDKERGTLILHESEEEGAVSAANLDLTADKWKNGNDPVLRIPHGVQAEIQMPSTGTDPVPFLNYTNGEVDGLLNRALSTLGLTAGSGSRALGEAVSVKEQKTFAKALNRLAEPVAKQLFPKLIRRLGAPFVNEDGSFNVRMPTWAVPVEEGVSDPVQLVKTVAEARREKLITWTRADEQHLRGVIGWNVDDWEEEAQAPDLQVLISAIGAGAVTPTRELEQWFLERFGAPIGAPTAIGTREPGDGGLEAAQKVVKLPAGIEDETLQAGPTKLSALLNRAIKRKESEESPRESIIDELARAAGIDDGTVNQILRGDIAVPPRRRLSGFARVLGLSMSTLIEAIGGEEELEAGEDAMLQAGPTKLSALLNRAIKRKESEESPRESIIDELARAAGIDDGTVNQILRGDIAVPPRRRLSGFAKVLGLSMSTLIEAIGGEEELEAAEDEPDPAPTKRQPSSTAGVASTKRGDSPPFQEERRGKLIVTGGDGRTFRFHRQLLAGERSVAFVSNEEERQRLDADFAQEVESIRDDNQAAVFALGDPRAIDNAEAQTERQRIIDEFTARYRTAIDRHVEAVNTAAKRQAAEERERQSADAESGPGLPSAEPLRSFVVRERDISELEKQQAAQTMAQRATGEAWRDWNAGVADTEFVTRITPTGLARDARDAANRAETVGRVEEAFGDNGGLQLTFAIRTSVRDSKRCKICGPPEQDPRGRDGLRWPLTTQEEVDAFIDDERSKVPDPKCEGTKDHCRCGLILGWGRP